MIEPSPGFKYVYLFALHPHCFFFKLTSKKMFHGFQLKLPGHYSKFANATVINEKQRKTKKLRYFQAIISSHRLLNHDLSGWVMIRDVTTAVQNVQMHRQNF